MGKFQIPDNPPTVNKTIRFPSDVVDNVEKAIQGKDCTFPHLLLLPCEPLWMICRNSQSINRPPSCSGGLFSIF